MSKKIAVPVYECERSWGKRVDEIKYFDADKMQDAVKFVQSFNAKNNEDEVPDWYMYAGDPRIVDDPALVSR